MHFHACHHDSGVFYYLWESYRVHIETLEGCYVSKRAYSYCVRVLMGTACRCHPWLQHVSLLICKHCLTFCRWHMASFGGLKILKEYSLHLCSSIAIVLLVDASLHDTWPHMWLFSWCSLRENLCTREAQKPHNLEAAYNFKRKHMQHMLVQGEKLLHSTNEWLQKPL